MGNIYDKKGLTELVLKRTKVKCSDSWIISEGQLNGFIKNISKNGTKVVYEIDDEQFNAWIDKYKVPKNYVSLRNAKECGISYMTARNAYDNGELEVKTLGFGTERKQYADRNELKRVGAKHPKCNIQ